MIYETFLSSIKERVGLALGDNYTLTLRKVPKNNGLILDGLCISKLNSPIAPAIYLNPFYEQYQEGLTAEEITKEVLALFFSSKPPSNMDYSRFLDFESMKQKIACRLINAQSNEILLKQIPHIRRLDLAIVFFLHIHEDDQGLTTALIHTEHLNAWGICLEELKALAMENVARLFPPVISSMERVLEDFREQTGETHPIPPSESHLVPFYVLSNTCGIYGAMCMFYRDVLKNFAEGMERDLILLPSSIHEVLLLPDEKNLSYEEMSQLVTHINHSEVPNQERLSNQVYVYSRETDTITVKSHNNIPIC